MFLCTKNTQLITVGERVAIKKIMNVFENRQEAKRILRECRILRVLRHCAYISDIIEVLPPLDFAHFKNLYVLSVSSSSFSVSSFL